MIQAVTYIRSSKDRAEVGLATQRAELKTFAKTKGFRIVAEFSDMEISGSLDETSRPRLRDLLNALRDPARKWNAVLALDTSRIARDPMLALYVTRECEKRNVAIHYSKMPVDGSSAFGKTMLSVVRAFDELHALLSGEKGAAGSRANIAAGFRSGGVAPFGFKLQHKETGGTRGGVAVRKSTLMVDAGQAKKVKAFLQARADGVARNVAAKSAKLQDKAVASLIAIERNALTYAGFTTWNRARKVKPTRDDPRKTMRWRPQSEWLVSEKPTHEALITRAQAERILASHGELQKRPPRVREPGKFVLSGLLFTPDGVQYHGDSHDHAYRAGMKGTRINAPYVEGEVLYRVAADFADRAFLQRTVAEARRMAEGIEDDPGALDKDIRKLERQMSNLLDLGAEGGDKAILARIREVEGKIAALQEQKAAWSERANLKKQLTAINEKDLRRALAATALKLRGDDQMVLDMIGYDDKQRIEPDQLRRVLTALVERVELDPKTRAFTIRYRLPVTVPGVKLATPRGFEPRLPP
jgi:site-specific DNA recombinase